MNNRALNVGEGRFVQVFHFPLMFNRHRQCRGNCEILRCGETNGGTKMTSNESVRVAPGATVPVGCTYNYRSGTGPSSPTFVQVVVTKIGASYVNPSSPNHPSEDGTPFTAFLLLQGGLPGCDSGSKPQGALLILNLHPYARLSVVVSLSGDGGSKFDLAPASFLRAGCSNGPNSPTGSSNAKLVYPAGQKKQP